ncbi:MAG: tetratricopeptide repeat protein [Candidatus Aminicenantes bacterium]|nr:tetratricopeptide repeat protein [Candidatus Aminicenantes bacterium]
MRFMRTLRAAAWIGAALILTAATASAQAGMGLARLVGNVEDLAGNPIPGAKILAEFTQDVGVKKEATANDKGEWSIIGMGSGNWTITASAEGYLPASVSYNVRQLERNPRLSIKLTKVEKASGLVQDESSLQILDEANAFYADGKYDTALMMFEQFLDKNPAVYQVLLNIGDCHREKAAYDLAVEKYNAVIERSKDDPAMGKTMKAKALAAIGLCYLRQNDLDQAQTFFKQSIETDPQDENLAYNVGEICFSNQQIDEAARYFTMASQIKPDWPDPYLKMAYVHLNTGDMTKAAESLEAYLKLETNPEKAAQAKAILDSIKK